MADKIYVTRIKAGGVDRQIDYNALANLPKLDTSLIIEGQPADSKAVGDRINEVENLIITPTLKGLGVNATAEELNYIGGVTDPVQKQLNAKQDKINGAATTIVKDYLDADKVLVSNADGKVGASGVSVEELGYLSGAKDNIQNQIDTAINDITTLYARQVNNNILINSNFANPINQRYKSEVDYIAAADYTGEYTIDRWKGVSVQLNLKSGYMTMKHYGENSSEQKPMLVQYVDFAKQYAKQFLTASIKYSVENFTDDTTAELSLKAYNEQTEEITLIGKVDLICDGEWHVAQLTIDGRTILDSLMFVITLYDKASTMNLEWAKLEVGDVATPYVFRPYAEEMQLCQMYWQKFDVTSGSTRGIDDDEFHFYATVPNKMRIASPKIILGDDIALMCCDLEHGGTKVIEGATINQSANASTAVNTFTNKLFLQCMLPAGHGITVGHHPYVYGVVILDAEIGN